MMILKDNITGKEAIYQTSIEYSFNKGLFNLSFVASHCSFNSYSSLLNDPLYLGDVIEVFVNVGEKNHYYEIEIAPNGALFLAKIFNDGNSFKNVGFLQPTFLSTKVKKQNDNLIVMLELDLGKLGWKENMPISFNAYRIETDNIASERHLFALNPTMCNSFHKLESFIRLEK